MTRSLTTAKLGYILQNIQLIHEKMSYKEEAKYIAYKWLWHNYSNAYVLAGDKKRWANLGTATWLKDFVAQKELAKGRKLHVLFIPERQRLYWTSSYRGFGSVLEDAFNDQALIDSLWLRITVFGRRIGRVWFEIVNSYDSLSDGEKLSSEYICVRQEILKIAKGLRAEAHLVLQTPYLFDYKCLS